MFATYDLPQWIRAEQTIGASLKHKNTQPLSIFYRENPQNSEPKNGPRRGFDFIALEINPVPLKYHGFIYALERDAKDM